MVWTPAGLSEAMLRGGSWQLGDKGTHYIKTIKNSSHHLANIINDILDAAAFSKGRLVIKREKVSASQPVLCCAVLGSVVTLGAVSRCAIHLSFRCLLLCLPPVPSMLRTR